MKATRPGALIAKKALSYVTPDDICQETSVNKGGCITLLKCYYLGKTVNCSDEDISDEAYCAEAAWSINRMAFTEGGYPTDLLDKIRTAGARQLLNNALAEDVKVDGTPSVGATFYRNTSSPLSTGHIGIVAGYDDSYLYTVEGNNVFEYGGQRYEGVWSWKYSLDDLEKRGFRFIHLEDLYGGDTTEDYNLKVTDNGDLFTLELKNSGGDSDLLESKNILSGIIITGLLGALAYGSYRSLKA